MDESAEMKYEELVVSVSFDKASDNMIFDTQ